MTGAAAGLATRTRWVGLLMEPGLSDREERLFLHGLRYVCPTCSLVTLEVGEASYSAYRSRGVDVVALVNFEGLEGSLPSLQGEGLWLIPLLGESDPPAGERVAAAVQQRTGQLLTGALEGLLAGEGGGPLRYTFGNRGLQVEVLDHGAITPGREQVLLEVAELLASGSLDPGADWIEGSEG